MSELHPLTAAVVSVLIVAASAFFVAIEFALIAARRYRLEEAAHTSVAARAALRSARDLTLLLAGSQLGITISVVALGAIAKPAVHHAFTPALELIGAPYVVADVAGFIAALIVVTFVHLVVGEMAPKSWAISHPEKSAILLALPMRAFMWLTRPALLALNGLANWCVRVVGVQPVNEVASGHGPDDLRELVAHSAKAGTLAETHRQQLATALELNTRPIADIVTPTSKLATVTIDAPGADITAAARNSGHLRLLVIHPNQGPVGVVHTRHALERPDATAADLITQPLLTMPAATPIYRALSTMRSTHNHLATVKTDTGGLVGLITLQDLVDQLLQTPPTPQTADS